MRKNVNAWVRKRDNCIHAQQRHTVLHVNMKSCKHVQIGVCNTIPCIHVLSCIIQLCVYIYIHIYIYIYIAYKVQASECAHTYMMKNAFTHAQHDYDCEQV
jgi:hypothetical protein